MAKFEVMVSYSYRVEDSKTVTVEAEAFDDIGEDELREAFVKAGSEFSDDEEVRFEDWTEDD